MAIASTDAWLLLVVSLPTGSSTARMRIWRALKALGCQALRDGAYLLPQGDQREQALNALATAAVLWRFKKTPEPAIVLAAAVIGLVAHPLLHHA